jgi:chemotaxis-related protein WspD
VAQLHHSANQLLNRDVPEDYLAERTAHFAAEKGIVQLDTTCVVVFRIGAEWLALPIDVLQEVAEECKVRTVPHRRGGVLSGLVNVRGELLLCVRLETLLGLEKVDDVPGTTARPWQARLLVCSRKVGRLAFLVSEVYGLHRYHRRDVRGVPATLAKAAAGTYTIGMLPWKDKMVGCLDGELLFYALNKGLT